MKIDSINPGRAINRNRSHLDGVKRAPTPPDNRPATGVDFKKIVEQNFEPRHVSDLRSLTPLSDEENSYLAQLFSASATPATGYDATSKHTELIIPGAKIDIEA